jgi:hypothetical protein
MLVLANFFLRAKHWQLFLLLCVVPTILEFTAAGYMPTTFRFWRDLGPVSFLFLGLMFVDMLCLFAWLWAMGSFLIALQKPVVRLKLSFFRIALIYAPVYGIAFFAVLLTYEPPVQAVLPLHLFAMYCMFYIFYFVARSLATVNKGKEVFFSDYAKPLILLLLYPIGVWRIQPRINQLYAQSTTSD